MPTLFCHSCACLARKGIPEAKTRDPSRGSHARGSQRGYFGIRLLQRHVARCPGAH